MASAVALLGFVSITLLLGSSVYFLHRLGAKEIAYMIAAVAMLGLFSSVLGALL